MNAPTIIVPDVSQIVNQDVNLNYPDDIKAKILHLLHIFPIISPSMMQIGIGSSLPANIWKPIMREMIKQGVLREDILVCPTPGGRHQSYTLLSLAETQIVKPSE